MKLTMIINDIETEQDNYTTIRLTRKALARGHEVALVSLVDLTYESDGSISGYASIPSAKEYEDDAELLADLQKGANGLTKVCLTDMDVMLLRSDPADEAHSRPWASNSSLLFAQIAAHAGVIVLNDPTHLTDASNKTYFQQYPEIVRPRTCISRATEDIKRFIEQENGRAVIKPLQGSGGQGVFVITEPSGGNLNQMIEATTRDGYAIVQEYLPGAKDGDLRLLTLNGKPLCVDGTYACFRRFNESGDARSNISAGGQFELAEPDSAALAIAELVAPKLIHDGMYLAGLDIVGDKLMEINVDTPGGINMAEDLTGKDFSGAIITDLERKVHLRDNYRGRLRNSEIATL